MACCWPWVQTFNAVYTLRNGGEFYRSFADGAWFTPARSLVERLVIPNATAFTIGLIFFEAAAAISILLRGDLVQPALFAGAAFALVAAAASSPGATAANLFLAALMAGLAITR